MDRLRVRPWDSLQPERDPVTRQPPSRNSLLEWRIARPKWDTMSHTRLPERESRCDPSCVTTPAPMAHVALAELREDLGCLRLCAPEYERAMERSLVRHGQLTSVLASRQPQGWLVIDGFKRLRSARSLSWSHLRVQPWEGDGVQAKLLLWQCNQNQGLTDLEEAWVVRALCREDGLSQPQIAQLFGRHKSWACRRLLLAEGLGDEVQADLRLGLLGVTMAREIVRLPRGNQGEVARLICRRGLTTRQATQLVDELLAAPDEAGLQRVLEAAAHEGVGVSSAADRRRHRTPGEELVNDVASVTRSCTRLHTRLLGRPLTSFGVAAADVMAQGLRALRPGLAVLEQTIEGQLNKLERMKES